MKKWRLGLDMGTNSIGWAALALGPDGEPCGLLGAGSRIFSDGRGQGKKFESNAVPRRDARQMRKTRDRRLNRRKKFMHLLVKHGLMPQDKIAQKDLENLDPWELRARGLSEKLEPYEFGRALYHLQQRRGFKSNRKTNAGDDDSNKISRAEKELKEAMKTEGARTPGEYLALRRRPGPKDDFRKAVDAEMERCGKSHLTGNKRKKAKNKIRKRLAAEQGVTLSDHMGSELAPARVRLKERLNEKNKKENYYDFYPTRSLVEGEFNNLWEAQKKHHGDDLTPDAYKNLLGCVLFQHDLQPQEVGKCTLDTTKKYEDREDRIPRAMPSFQNFRIYQDINHLTVQIPGRTAACKLTPDQRKALVRKAQNSKSVSFDDAREILRKYGLSEESRFNMERGKRKSLLGDKTAQIVSAKWGKGWHKLKLERQDEVIEQLLNDETGDEEVIGWLAEKYGLDAETAKAVTEISLPEGHGNLGRTATRKILDALAAPEEVLTYDQAVKKAGYADHSDIDRDDGKYHGRELPYYGEILERHTTFRPKHSKDENEKQFGKIANPTVHVALNQLRRVYNALLAKHGAPKEIVIELARDLPLSALRKRELEKRQKENQDRNERHREEVQKLLGANAQPSREDLSRYRLWEELKFLDKRCPYSGKRISCRELFSSNIHIEHILPLRRTGDDSFANKTLAIQEANDFKRDKTPYEAFHMSPGPYDWEEIKARAANLPPNKSWRFEKDAMNRYEEDKENGFLKRHLNDTGYISRITAAYLTRTGAKVWTTPGLLTAELRRLWGLNSILRGHNQPEEKGAKRKNRDDHRHHAIDAVVVGLTSRKMLKRAADDAARAKDGPDKHWLVSVKNPPWPDFHARVREIRDLMVVSHKTDHGKEGSLHREHAHRIIEASADKNKKGKFLVVRRRKLTDLNPDDVRGKKKYIRDKKVREKLQDATADLAGDKFKAALLEAGKNMSPPVRSVRICEKLSVVQIQDKNRPGAPPKAYDGNTNYCLDVWADNNGKWAGEIISRFEANRADFNPWDVKSREGNLLIMRLRKNDLLAIEAVDEQRQRLMYVAYMTKGSVFLAEHFEANVAARSREKEFKYSSANPQKLQKLKARLVRVDPSGRVFDPGPPE